MEMLMVRLMVAERPVSPSSTRNVRTKVLPTGDAVLKAHPDRPFTAIVLSCITARHGSKLKLTVATTGRHVYFCCRFLHGAGVVCSSCCPLVMPC